MATLTTAEIINLRNKQHRSKFYLSVLQPTTLLTALVNNGSIARGDRSIAYDNGSGDYASIEAGQTLWIGTTAGDNDVGRVRVKSITGSATSGTITIDENGIDWIDNLHLTILHNYEVWPIRPSTRSGIYYRFYDTTYSDQNLAPKPVTIAGPHQAGFLASGSLVLNVPIGDSYAIAQGASISSRSVTVSPSTGVTVGSFSAGVIPITYTQAGTYWVKASTTDSNGKSQLSYRVHFIHDSDNLPYFNFEINGLSGDWDSGGWRYNALVYGDATLSDFPDGSVCVLWREGRINDTVDYVNIWDIGDNIICVGHIRQENDRDQLGPREGGTAAVSFTVETPEAVINNRHYGTSDLEPVASTPALWRQYASWLTVGRTIDHLIQWQSTIKETADILGLLDNTIGSPGGAFIESSLYQQVNGQAQKIFGKIVSDRLGRLHLSEDIQMLNETDRDAFDNVFSITRQDISEVVNITRNNEKQLSTAFLAGGYWTGTATSKFVSMIGGYLDGADPVTIPEPTGQGVIDVTNRLANSQTDNDEKCGRILAAANNQLQEIRIPLRGDYLGAFDIDPQLGWYQWNIGNTQLSRQLTIDTARLICRRCEAQINVRLGTIESNVIFEAEAFGPDGIIADYPTGYPTPPLPSPNWTLPTTADLNITVTEPITVSEATSFSTETAGSTWSAVTNPNTTVNTSDGTYIYGHVDGSFISRRYDMAADSFIDINDAGNALNGGPIWTFKGTAASHNYFNIRASGATINIDTWDGTLNDWTEVHDYTILESLFANTTWMTMSQSRLYVITGDDTDHNTNANLFVYYTTDGTNWVQGTVDQNGMSDRSPYLWQQHYATLDRGAEGLESDWSTAYILMWVRRDLSTRRMLVQLTSNGLKYIEDDIEGSGGTADLLIGGPGQLWRWDDSASRWQYRTTNITSWNTGWTTPALVGGNEIVPIRSFNTPQMAGWYFDPTPDTLSLYWFDLTSGAWTTTGETIQTGQADENEIFSVHRADTGEVIAITKDTGAGQRKFWKRDTDIP